MEEIGKKSKKTQKSVNSKSGIGKQSSETVATNNKTDPQTSPTLQQQTHRQSPQPNNNDLKDSVTEKNSIQPPPTPATNNSISSSKDLLKKNYSDNSFSNHNDSSSSNNSLNQNNNNNQIVNSTANITSATPTTDSSTYQKYLHKKFKRIASATDDSSESLTVQPTKAVSPQPQSTATPTVKPSFLSNGHVNGNTSSPSPSSSSHNNDGSPLTVQGDRQPPTTAAAIIINNTATTTTTTIATTTTTTNDIVVNQNNSTGRNICPFCNSTFNKPSVLEKHIRTHTNERPYPCEICNLAFKTKSNYYKHCR